MHFSGNAYPSFHPQSRNFKLNISLFKRKRRLWQILIQPAPQGLSGHCFYLMNGLLAKLAAENSYSSFVTDVKNTLFEALGKVLIKN